MNRKLETLQKVAIIWVLMVGMVIYGWAKNYKGAEYRTKQSFLYGRFETRYLPPAGSGFLASFFTFHDFESTSEWNEIDFEILGRYNCSVQMTSIGPWQTIRPSHQWVAFNPHLDFHVYAFEWTPEYIAWFVDGQEVYRQDEAFVADFNFPQKIMMNIWNPEYENWVGPWFDESLPVKAVYDYVSYAAYTPDSGNCGTNNNFTLLWKDEFDFWDQNRWEKATHTFQGNRCDFTPENAQIKDGYLTLYLTDAEHVGGQDVQPPTMLWVWAIGKEVFVRFNEEPDSASAVNRNNYTIPGVNITKATLLRDRQTVKLETTNLQADRSYNLVCLNVLDKANPPNKQLGQVKTFKVLQMPQFPMTINVGGDSLKAVWADRQWQPDALFGYCDGAARFWSTEPEIANTTNDSLFWSEREGLVQYKLRVPQGQYRLKLWFCENQFETSDQRRFDVWINGQKVASALDLVKQFGYRTAGALVVDSLFSSEGEITIHFSALKGKALLNAIEIEMLTTALESPKTVNIPAKPLLFSSYPNPFNHSAILKITTHQVGDLLIEVFASNGQKVWQKTFSALPTGQHFIRWQPELASGVYYARAVLNRQFVQINKMVLLK